MGLIQNQAQFEKVKEFLEDARQNGKIVAGGGVLEREGYFVQPTIVCDIPETARLVREEQFGPVLPVMRYFDIDEVINRANDTGFGLGGSVRSSDRVRRRGADRRRYGLGEQACRCLCRHTVLGRKAVRSLGVELAQEGLEAFTQASIINLAK